MTRVVLVPPVLAFLPEYAGLEDPVADVRAAALKAVSWLGADVTVIGDAQAQRVGEYLLDASTRTGSERSVLVLGNGSARRTDASPGPYDERAVGWDDAVRTWLLEGGPAPAWELAEELWASAEGLRELDGLGRRTVAAVDYDDAPDGVQYWVVRWTCDD